MCSQQLSVLHWIILIIKLKKYLLAEIVYLFIRCDKTKFFLWNTNRNITLERAGGVQLWAWMLLNVWFLTVQEKQLWRQHFFKLEIYQEAENSCFIKKILYTNELKVKKVSLNVPGLLLKIVLSRTWKKLPAISKILCSSWNIFKNKKIPGFYMHTDI